MEDNTTQVSEQINSAVNNALGVGALAAIYTGNFVNIGLKIKGGASEVSLIEKTITENGTYTASDDGADGYSEVTVNVESDLTEKTITANGTYTASDDGADGYSEVTVNVESDLTEKTITANGTYTASDDGADGYSEVTVNVPIPVSVIPDIKHGGLNGYMGADGKWLVGSISGVINSVYEITPSHEYLYYLGANIGNRLNISLYDRDPTTVGTDYQGRKIVKTENPPTHSTTYFVAGEGETHMAVTLDYGSVADCNGYLLDITDLEV